MCYEYVAGTDSGGGIVMVFLNFVFGEVQSLTQKQ